MRKSKIMVIYGEDSYELTNLTPIFIIFSWLEGFILKQIV
jgi:hypothetical protein